MVNIFSKPWFPIVTASLMTLFFILYLQECSKPDVDDSVETENHALKERVAVLESGIKLVNDSLKQIQAARAIEVSRHTQDSTRQSNQIARLSRGYTKAKQEVQQLQDSSGRIGTYIAASDSLLEAKDSIYRQEVSHRMALELSYKVEIATLGERHVKQVQVSEEYKARTEQLSRQNERLTRRLERKRKFNGVLLGVAGGLAAAVTVMALTE